MKKHSDRRQHNRVSSRCITIRYLLAIALVAVAVIGGYFYIQHYISANKNYAYIINISGKQRMLSQRIVLLSNRLALMPDGKNSAHYAALLSQAISTMQKTHNILATLARQDNHPIQTGVPSGQTTVHVAESQSFTYTYDTYFEEPYLLDDRVKNFLYHSQTFLNAYYASLTDGTDAPLDKHSGLHMINMQVEESLLNALDHAVTEYQNGQEQALSEFKVVQTLLLISILVLLLLEGVIIFRPLVQRVDGQMRALERARRKADELNRLKSDFLANMSHEIRTPMNGILGIAELILGSKLTPQQEGYARTIISSGESLLNIINDILDFSKIEANKMELDLMPIDLLELADDITMLYSVQARDIAIELVIRYVPGSEQFVYADPVRLRQILTNLVSNSIKFTEKGHIIITIKEDRQQNIHSNEEAVLHFSVEDTGIGMTEEACSRIFEKFTQADSSTTRHYGGTGLGLSISKSLVELMGGTLSVNSEVGKGTQFSFMLSLKRNSQEVQILPSLPVLHGIKVLIVDDLPVIRTLVREQLTDANVRCDTAISGEEALNMLTSAHQDNDPYDMAILDYLMPEMNGEMLACAINDYPELRNLCLVMLTGAGNPLADEDFVSKGFSAYIPKPVSNRGLLRSMAIIWERYLSGDTDVLIRIDSQTLDVEEHHNRLLLPGAHILVAEDNLINQMFVKEILQDMEVDCTIVSNGREAVNAVAQQRFDAILMDCLMPEMDGFEATRRICRLKDEGLLPHGLPIIALTANAMKGDKERCFEAGMDEYMSKPVRKKLLQETIYRLVKKTLAEPEILAKPDSDKEEHVHTPSQEHDETHTSKLLDEEATQQARLILKDKYDDMVGVFITNSRERLEELHQAITSGVVEEMVRPAHTLKSTSMQMGAIALSDKAKELEKLAKSGNSITHMMRMYISQISDLLEATDEAFQQ